jgi:hypothetical protein
MRARSVAGYLLLVLAAVSAIELTLDSALVHVPMRQQWRAAQTPGHGVARLSHRNTPGVPGNVPAGPILTPAGAVAAVPSPDLVSAPFAAVFVPPRA